MDKDEHKLLKRIKQKLDNKKGVSIDGFKN